MVWTHLLPRKPPATDPQLWGVHVSGDGRVWVWGQIGFSEESLDPNPPNGLMIRYYDGVDWSVRDRANLVWFDHYYAIQMLSVYGLLGGTAFSSPDKSRWGYFTGGAPTSNVAKWTDPFWTDQFLEDGCVFVGRNDDDIYALIQQPIDFACDDKGVNWLHWDGATWSGIQSAHILPELPVGSGFAGGETGGVLPAGRLADICPDGVIIYAGALSAAASQLARAVPGGTADLVLEISGGLVHHFRAVWTPLNNAIYAIAEFDSARGLYFWDRVDPPTWVLLDATPFGYGICIHGAGPTDYWTGIGLQMAHWNGTAYTVFALPDPHPGVSTQASVHGVWEVANNDVWAVGKLFNPNTGHYEAPVWHWNGIAWAVVKVFTA